MRPQKPGFTLLELLTVIAVLGLLVSILLPSLSAARRTAKANVCLSHLKAIGNGLALYLNENDDQLPPFRLKRPSPTAEPDVWFINRHGRRAPRWQWFIETDLGPVINPQPYRYAIGRIGFFDDNTPARPGGGLGTTLTVDLFRCPALDDDEFAMDVRNGAYGYNYQYLGNARQGFEPTRWDNFPVGLHRIRNPALTVAVADSRGAGRRHGRHSYTLDPPRLGTEVRATRFGPKEAVYNGDPQSGDVPLGLDPAIYAYSPAEARHKDRSNVLFVDTHAEAMTPTELGYQVSDGTTPPDVPRGVPIPIHDPLSGTYTADNKLFTGVGRDSIAQEHKPAPP